MTADEIRKHGYADFDTPASAEWEIALQLALGNERLERIATALEQDHPCRSCRGRGWITHADGNKVECPNCQNRWKTL